MIGRAVYPNGAVAAGVVIALLAASGAGGQIRKKLRNGAIELPAGTRMSVRLEESLDSRRTVSGEEFAAVLVKPVYWGRHTVIPKASMVHGVVVEVKQPVMRVTGASITIVFDRVETPDGRVIPIAAGVPGDFDLGETLGKGAAFAGKHVVKQVINTAVGGWLTPLYIADYARRGVQFVQKDKNVVIPAGTVLVIYLQRPVRVAL